jgi:hypothetical protein
MDNLMEIHQLMLTKNQEMQIRRVPTLVYFDINIKFETSFNSTGRVPALVSADFPPGKQPAAGALSPELPFIAKGESAVPFPGVECEA